MSTRRVLVLSFIDKYSGLVIHTAASMVIARLLTPAEIGVYSVVMVLVGFAATFRDLGAGQYLISRRELTSEVLRLTFTVQLSLGAALSVLIGLAAVPVALFYGDERMREICFVLSLNFLITPWLAYPNAVLFREMRFGSIAVVRLIGAVTHAAVAIGLCLVGQGPISLAWANLLTTVASIIAMHLVARLDLPRRPAVRGMKSVLTFGGQMTGISLLNTVKESAAGLTLGRIQGMGAAGHMSRAQGLVGMFAQLVLHAANQVALPFYSKRVRERQDVVEPFLLAVSLITGLGWSFFSVLGLMAYPTVRVLYGSQWDEAVDPVRWLSLAASLGLPGLMCSAPLVALGATRELLYVSAANAILAVLAAIVGAQFDVVTTTQLLCIASACASGLLLRLACLRIGTGPRDLFKVFLLSAVLAAASTVVPAIVIVAMGPRSSSIFVCLAIAVPGAAIGLLASAWVTQHPLWLEFQRALDQVLRVVKRTKDAA